MKRIKYKVCLLLMILSCGCRAEPKVQIWPQLPRQYELKFKQMTEWEKQILRAHILWILRNQYVLQQFEEQSECENMR